MKKTVTIYGSGIAGMQLANALSKVADVTVVSPIDYFEVPMAMPRLMVEPDFADAALVPLTQFDTNITFVQGKLTSFTAEGGTVETTTGETITISSDVSVLATGSRYANSITRAQSGTVKDRVQEFKDSNDKLLKAKRVVIVGGGPIGVELAGEITEDYPGIAVTVVEASDEILTGTSRKVAAYAQKALEDRGVTFVKGEKVTAPAYGVEPSGGSATTDQGSDLPFDMIFWAVGSRPNTDYMDQAFVNERGQIKVDAHLQVKGLTGVYALGDVTDVKEVKKAIYIGKQVPVVAKNIGGFLKGNATQSYL